MVKSTSLTKQELVDVLGSAKTSKERNRAVKLLKQFDPIPRYEFDDEGYKSKMRPKKYDYLLGYMCFRCDKVKQSNFKVIWSTSKGNKQLCYPCYTQLAEREEVAVMRAANQKAGIIPKGFGLGLTGVVGENGQRM
ncbi:hypothetical protein AK812_SmicGene15841 [Symbiodinium microadriaticum]|uniref:Uncharacterized protein n=1 Tax=Symbiodinium microadriaticum TaxID=2951 RepID=A0A1Q9E1V2_SYMMI|nr:hypothetical protein AK812_SmicGene15841 [Symbiodinium microadriaticum]|mmetsp:Transcript_128118/g.304166  ORF Transcript_128118/g.304166 Transcript_128118/m.304166 type:complete len:136 (-) Transcript_128118:48-455(-)|eukprot:CAMPEP_0181469452 /NCGR_PEP_ID=MMETSP1110-20121109/38024_1 /TAXON_ID=174948 /ORGANISM="Symbiodinium sp., Strain CCMP421" /LENGTH=135 /DNA_ID=CAMNT_0023594355 /DNA_START=65 /DNA_END=472 /DNA_ORIENTATION=+